MFNNKKGYSTGFAWIFGLVILFGLGILYIVFNQVFMTHLVPIISEQITDSDNVDDATKEAALSGINRYMNYFHALPFVLFMVVIVYLFITAIRRERESEFM